MSLRNRWLQLSLVAVVLAVLLLGVEQCSESAAVHPAWSHAVMGLESNRVAANILSSPAFQDAQRLIASPADYGALFIASPSVNLGGALPAGQTVQVAYVLVKDGGVPSTSLFQNGYTCVYLRRNSGASDFDAFLEHVGGAAATCPNTPSAGADSLKATVSPSSIPAAQLPTAVRWEVGVNSKLLYLGLPCRDRWCTIAPDTANLATSVGGSHHTRNVRGWYDEQDLAVPGGSGAIVPSPLTARLFPSPTLKDHDAMGYWFQWREVATIQIPPGQTTGAQTAALRHYSEERWKMRDGNGRIVYAVPGDEVRIEIRNEWPAGWDGRYSLVRDGKQLARSNDVTVKRSGVDVPTTGLRILMHGPPGTARWGWQEEDESVWVRCGSGCCEVGFY